MPEPGVVAEPPSFVSSLSGLLAFLGLQAAILGDQGSVNLPLAARSLSLLVIGSVALLVVLELALNHAIHRTRGGRTLLAVGGILAAVIGGLTLLNLDSSHRFIITGLVLAVAIGDRLPGSQSTRLARPGLSPSVRPHQEEEAPCPTVLLS